MDVIETPLQDVLLLLPRVYTDERGFFLERFHEDRYREIGIDRPFVQDNHSRSIKGVLRGLHFQVRSPQAKLVEVVRGSVFDVVADLRPESPTFRRWYSVELSDQNHHQLWIPAGFAHGFYTLSDEADFLYKCTSAYDSNDEGGVAWNDPELNIAWPTERPILSAKDERLPFLSMLREEDLPQMVQGVLQ